MFLFVLYIIQLYVLQTRVRKSFIHGAFTVYATHTDLIRDKNQLNVQYAVPVHCTVYLVYDNQCCGAALC
jgi:hypothetical protein